MPSRRSPFRDRPRWSAEGVDAPHGICESAMKAARSPGRSPAREAPNFSRSRQGNRPSAAGSAARERRGADWR